VLAPLFRCNMVFASHFRVLAAAFFMGLAAGAPIGPVNMRAIRRGLTGSWYDTVACGIGSTAADLPLFSLMLLGGHYVLSDITNPALQNALATTSVIILLPLGIYFLVRTVKSLLHTGPRGSKHWENGAIAKRLVDEITAGVVLTLLNPLTVVYWIGASLNWLPYAHSTLGFHAPRWGILMVAAGLMTWFTFLVFLVRFIPQSIGPVFFLLVNAILGLILVGFGTFFAIALSRHNGFLPLTLFLSRVKPGAVSIMPS